MRNFTEEERKLAVEMWKKIKNSPFRYPADTRKEFAEKHGLKWVGDNFLCHVFIENGNCGKCPIKTASGKCGKNESVYRELITIYTWAKKKKKRWKSLCRDFISEIESLTPDNKEGGEE